MKKKFIILVFIFAVCFIHVNTYSKSAHGAKSTLDRLSNAFVDVSEEVRPAVVNISTESTIVQERGLSPFMDDDIFRFFFGETPSNRGARRQKVHSLGSGFIISEDGYILTNDHVVRDADKIDVTLLDGQKYEAELLGTDSMIDVALLKIEAKDLPYTELGDSRELSIGQWVVAIGNPFGLNFSVTAGIISALGRKGITQSPLQQLIQTDAAINKGNSGGPLLDLNGRVIGINTAIVSRTGGFEGLGFAVPINMVKDILAQLKKDGQVRRGYLGIRMQPLDETLKEGFKFKDKGGVLVAEVTEDSAASKAGLKSGDIIVGIDDKEINDYQDAFIAISTHQPGDKIKIRVFRDNRYKNITAKLGERPGAVAKKSDVRNDDIGLKVQSLTETVRSKYRIPRDINGVVIVYVEPGKIAQGAGLKEGDVILSIENIKVNTMDDYLKAISGANTKDGVMFYIYREGSKIYTYYSK